MRWSWVKAHFLHRTDVELLEKVQRRPQNNRGLQGSEDWSTSIMERAERDGVFSLDRRTLQGDFIVTFEYLRRASKKDHHDL